MYAFHLTLGCSQSSSRRQETQHTIDGEAKGKPSQAHPTRGSIPARSRPGRTGRPLRPPRARSEGEAPQLYTPRKHGFAWLVVESPNRSPQRVPGSRSLATSAPSGWSKPHRGYGGLEPCRGDCVFEGKSLQEAIAGSITTAQFAFVSKLPFFREAGQEGCQSSAALNPGGNWILSNQDSDLLTAMGQLWSH